MLPKRAAQQLNGHEGETATLLSSVFGEIKGVAWCRFRPASSQPFTDILVYEGKFVCGSILILQISLSVLIALCLLVVQTASAQNPSALSAEQIAAKVDEYLNAAVKVDDFSGSVLVARDGKLIFNKSYGLANVELGAPNTPQTVFRIASISKPFTATATMMLHERGKLNINDSVCKYLDNCPAAWQPITVKHLLTHTSGISDYLYFPDFIETIALPVTHEKMIGRFRNKPLEFAPGEKFAYNNSGDHLLAVIIERASGKVLTPSFCGKTFSRPSV